MTYEESRESNGRAGEYSRASTETGPERRRQRCQDDEGEIEMAGTRNDREIENTRSKTGFGRTLRSKDW